MRAWSLGAHIPHGHHELISKAGSQILNKLTSTSSLGNGAAVGLSSVCSCFLRDEQLERLVPTVGRWSKINLVLLGRWHSYCRKWWNGICGFLSALGYDGCPSAACTVLNGNKALLWWQQMRNFSFSPQQTLWKWAMRNNSLLALRKTHCILCKIKLFLLQPHSQKSTQWDQSGCVTKQGEDALQPWSTLATWGQTSHTQWGLEPEEASPGKLLSNSHQVEIPLCSEMGRFEADIIFWFPSSAST